MKTRWKLAVLAWFGFLVQAEATGLSARTNGVYLAIGGWRAGVGGITNEPIRWDDGLVFMLFEDLGKTDLYRPRDPAYGVKVVMTDPDGKQAPRRPLGKRYGSKFEALRTCHDTPLLIETAWGAYRDNPQLGGGKNLPRPEDLFEMEKPGTYLLRVQMQMFRFTSKVTNQVAELVRFSPVTIKVDKPKAQTRR